MAKKRKTREQKKLADLRHTLQHKVTNTFELKIPTTNFETRMPTVAVVNNAYPYLKKDLSKTLFLTSLILAFQVILFFLLRNHLMFIPGLSY